MTPLAQLYAMMKSREANPLRAQFGASDPGGPIYLDSQVADPNTPHFLSFGDNQVQLVGERPRVNMNYRDPDQAGPAPPTMSSLASMYGGRR